MLLSVNLARANQHYYIKKKGVSNDGKKPLYLNRVENYVQYRPGYTAQAVRLYFHEGWAGRKMQSSLMLAQVRGFLLNLLNTGYRCLGAAQR